MKTGENNEFVTCVNEDNVKNCSVFELDRERILMELLVVYFFCNLRSERFCERFEAFSGRAANGLGRNKWQPLVVFFNHQFKALTTAR